MFEMTKHRFWASEIARRFTSLYRLFRQQKTATETVKNGIKGET